MPFFGSYDGADDVVRMNHNRQRDAWHWMVMLQPVSTPMHLFAVNSITSTGAIQVE